MINLHVSHHPLIQHTLTRLRDDATPPGEFRHLARVLSQLLLYEATADLPTRDATITTPMESCQAPLLSRPLTLVAILRAGLGMLHGMLDVLPEARVGHVGFARNEDTLQPEHYYSKLPEDIGQTNVLVLDPMLATGGTAAATLQLIKEAGAREVRFVCLVAAPQGVEALHDAHHDIPVHAASLDASLTDNGFILPGLGDAGDRLFGTF